MFLACARDAAPREAQQLIRQSDPRLTMNVYAHVGMLPTSKAMARVKLLGPLKPAGRPTAEQFENVAKTTASSGLSSTIADTSEDRVRVSAEELKARGFQLESEALVLDRRVLSALDLLLRFDRDNVAKIGPRSSVG